MTPEEIAALVADSACFACMSEHELMTLQTYLLAVLAEGSMDPATLLESAACFRCMSQEQLLQVQAYLLSQINAA